MNFLGLARHLHSLQGMPRPKRIFQFDHPYSITTRTNNQEFYLQSREVYNDFQNIFKKLKRIRSKEDPKKHKYRFKVHHFLLMSNHYHLVVLMEPGTPIDLFMQQLNSMVARTLNKRLGRTGHIWGDRYKAKILNSYDYLRQTIGYIYQNPVKAGIVADPKQYSASTLPYYIRGRLPFWTEPDPVFLLAPPAMWPVLMEDLLLTIPSVS